MKALYRCKLKIRGAESPNMTKNTSLNPTISRRFYREWIKASCRRAWDSDWASASVSANPLAAISKLRAQRSRKGRLLSFISNVNEICLRKTRIKTHRRATALAWVISCLCVVSNSKSQALRLIDLTLSLSLMRNSSLKWSILRRKLVISEICNTK